MQKERCRSKIPREPEERSRKTESSSGKSKRIYAGIPETIKRLTETRQRDFDSS
jgi:hypothetical protein